VGFVISLLLLFYCLGMVLYVTFFFRCSFIVVQYYLHVVIFIHLTPECCGSCLVNILTSLTNVVYKQSNV